MAAVPSIGRATRVERAAAPGAQAAGELYERYSGQILSYCMRQLGSREEAEDAVQTTFMNAFRGLQRGIKPELESAWLFKIAHNVCLSRRRSSWRRGRVEAPNNFEVLQEVIPGREHVSDELIRLQDVLEEMPENQRRAILLREWQGLTYREISSELGLSQAAIETLIFRARRALAQGLEQDADTWKRRLRRGADAGGAVACIQALLSGGGAAALKVGATVMAVTATAVAVTPTPQLSSEPHRAQAKRTVATAPEKSRRLTSSHGLTRITLAPAPGRRTSGTPKLAPKASSRSLPNPLVLLPAESPAEAPAPPPSEAPSTAPATPEAPAAPPPSLSSPPPAPAAAQSAPTAAPTPAAGDTARNDRADRHPQAAALPQAEPAATPAAPQPQPEPTPQTRTTNEEARREAAVTYERPARPEVPGGAAPQPRATRPAKNVDWASLQ